MSSDSSRQTQNPETDHPQGMQTLVTAGQVEPVQQVVQAKKNPLPRLTSPAVSGQGMAFTQQSPAPGQTSLEQVETAVSKISDFVQDFQRDLVFRIDEERDRLVLNVVDSKTRAVIRQIPSED